MARVSRGDEQDPARRITAEIVLARLLSHDITLFTPKDKSAAILAAYVMGADLADETHGTDEEAYGDAKDYRRVCVHWALHDVRVCNDVEADMFRRGGRETSDSRLIAFRAGFLARKRELDAGR